MKALGLLLATVFASWSAHTQPADHPPEFYVTYGILLDGKEPKAGSTYCSIDKTCALIDDGDIRLELAISGGLRGGAELSVICHSFDCSFAGRMPRVIVHDHSTLYLVEGSDVGITHDLVARVNRSVGSVKLDIRTAP